MPKDSLFARYGRIVKFSRKGLILKTYEGELLQFRCFANGAIIGDKFAFSVKDKRVVEDIKQAMDNGGNVTLHYYQAFFAFPWDGDTTYFITKVSEVK